MDVELETPCVDLLANIPKIPEANREPGYRIIAGRVEERYLPLW